MYEGKYWDLSDSYVRRRFHELMCEQLDKEGYEAVSEDQEEEQC